MQKRLYNSKQYLSMLFCCLFLPHTHAPCQKTVELKEEGLYMDGRIGEQFNTGKLKQHATVSEIEKERLYILSTLCSPTQLHNVDPKIESSAYYALTSFMIRNHLLTHSDLKSEKQNITPDKLAISNLLTTETIILLKHSFWNIFSPQKEAQTDKHIELAQTISSGSSKYLNQYQRSLQNSYQQGLALQEDLLSGAGKKNIHDLLSGIFTNILTNEQSVYAKLKMIIHSQYILKQSYAAVITDSTLTLPSQKYRAWERLLNALYNKTHKPISNGLSLLKASLSFMSKDYVLKMLTQSKTEFATTASEKAVYNALSQKLLEEFKILFPEESTPSQDLYNMNTHEYANQTNNEHLKHHNEERLENNYSNIDTIIGNYDEQEVYDTLLPLPKAITIFESEWNHNTLLHELYTELDQALENIKENLFTQITVKFFSLMNFLAGLSTTENSQLTQQTTLFKIMQQLFENMRLSSANITRLETTKQTRHFDFLCSILLYLDTNSYQNWRETKWSKKIKREPTSRNGIIMKLKEQSWFNQLIQVQNGDFPREAKLFANMILTKIFQEIQKTCQDTVETDIHINLSNPKTAKDALGKIQTNPAMQAQKTYQKGIKTVHNFIEITQQLKSLLDTAKDFTQDAEEIYATGKEVFNTVVTVAEALSGLIK